MKLVVKSVVKSGMSTSVDESLSRGGDDDDVDDVNGADIAATTTAAAAAAVCHSESAKK